MVKRIMMCGASGVGKTTLAEFISEEYNIPYVNTSASDVWEYFGFKNQEDAVTNSILDLEIGLKYQLSILHNRERVFNRDSFVCDRSFIDNVVYTLLEIGHKVSECDLEIILKRCDEYLNRIDGLIYIKYPDNMLLQDNKSRVNNKYYQRLVDSVFDWIINSNILSLEDLNILILDSWDFEKRKKIVNSWIKE